ncbi:MAG: hypothetical protein R2725_13485 [Solirubrobacterales bacterium]
MSHLVYIVGRERPFYAEEVEYLPSGWLRASGWWLRWDIDDDSGEPIVRKARGEHHWPAHRIHEVRRHD